MENINTDIEKRIRDYYEKYYKDQLGLKDWEHRCELRLNEEKIYCNTYIERIESWLNYDFNGKKVLVVGSGTGGELVNFHNLGAKVYGIEPNVEAFKISLLKAKKIGLNKDQVKCEYSENIGYEDNSFDFVYCYTVLEHVQDVEKSLSEMIRTTRENGYLFIQTPDYRQLYEPHYKLPLPMILPNLINKMFLWFLKKPTTFLDTLNKLNSLKMKRFFQKLPVNYFRIYTKYEKFYSESPVVRIIFKIQYTLFAYFGVSFNQAWILQKIKNS